MQENEKVIVDKGFKFIKGFKLSKEMIFSFDATKLKASVRCRYDFSENWDKASIYVTECSNKNLIEPNVLYSIILELSTVNKMLNYSNYVLETNDFKTYLNQYGNKINLFYSTEKFNYWIRLVPIEEDNNVYIKCYSK